MWDAELPMSIIRASLHRTASGNHRSPRNSVAALMVLIFALVAFSGSISASDVAGEQSESTETKAGRGVLSPTLPRYVIGAGGGRSGGGVYGIQGTIGQPDAEPIQPSSGGPYAIIGGFWPGLTSARAWWLFGDGFEGSAD